MFHPSANSRTSVIFDESDIVCFDELCNTLLEIYFADSGVTGVSVSFKPFESFRRFKHDLSNEFLSSSTELNGMNCVLHHCLSNEAVFENHACGSDTVLCGYPCFEDAAGDVIAVVLFAFSRSLASKSEEIRTFVTFLLRPLIEEWYDVCGNLLLQAARLSSDRLLYKDRKELRARYSQFETLALLGNIAIVETDKPSLMKKALHLTGTSLFSEDPRKCTIPSRNPSVEHLNPVGSVFLIAGFDVCVGSYPIAATQCSSPAMSASSSCLRLSQEEIGFLTEFSRKNLPDTDVVYGIRQAEIRHFIQNIELGFANEGTDTNSELRMVRLAKKSGRQLVLGVFFHSRHCPSGDFSTFMISVAEIMVNALDRMFIERQLFQSEQQLRYIWRSVKEAVVAFRERTGVIVETNSVAEQVFGISAQHPIAEYGDVADPGEWVQNTRKIAHVFRKFDQFYHLPDSADGIRTFVEVVAQIEEEDSVVTLQEHPGIRFSMSVSKTFDPITESPLCVVVFRDVSEANRRQAAEIQAVKSEVANKMKTMVMNTLSHELRNPIQGILSMSQILQEEKSLSRYQRDCVGYITSATDFLLLLIADVLDSSRIETGKFVLEQRPFDMLLTAEECVDLMTLQVNSKKIELVVVCDPKLQFLVIGDSRRTKQIILNLLSNAVKFTPVSGSIQLKIGVRQRDDVNVFPVKKAVESHPFYENTSIIDVSSREMVILELQVVDNGIGFDDNEAHLLWSPFSQLGVSSTGLSQQYLGTGLGLSITATLVQRMNGDYDMFSRGRGAGSTFSVRIPFHIPPDSENVLAARLHQIRSHLSIHHELASLHVLALGRSNELIPGIQQLVEMMSNEISTALVHPWEHGVWPCGSLQEMLSIVRNVHGNETENSKNSKIFVLIDMDDEEGLVSLCEGPQEQHRPASLSTDSCNPVIFPILVSSTHEDDILCDSRAQNILKTLSSRCDVKYALPNILRKPSRLELIFDVLWKSTTASDIVLWSFQKFGMLDAESSSPSSIASGDLSTSTETGEESREILIVDDDVVVRKVMSLLLKKAGFKVHTAVDGKQGIDTVLQRAAQVCPASTETDSCRIRMFDVVLMDVIMPVMDGVEACKELRRNGFVNLPIVGCTANCVPDAAPEDSSSTSENGWRSFLNKTMFSDCLLKPVRKADLIAMIDKWAPQQSSHP
eukprot:ANDGO_04564.mRNA.1 Hybrid signal transduction histidine kinase B